MNRFTKDMATIDDMLPLVLFDLIQVSHQHHHDCGATQSCLLSSKKSLFFVCLVLCVKKEVISQPFGGFLLLESTSLSSSDSGDSLKEEM